MDKRRVLIVDDEEDLVKIVAFTLKHAGYDILTAYNGNEGLRAAQEEKPDLIILDLMLPKMDGYKICALLKANSKYSHIPIIIFTARAQETDKEMSKEAGANAYISKPFEPEVLLDMVKKLLREKK